MTFSRSRLRFVLLLAGISMVLVGVAALVVGAVALAAALDEPRLTPASGPTVTIPAGGGSTTIYTAEPAGDGPYQLGCELLGADGKPEALTRMDSFTHALRDAVTVEETTWHPFTEIELRSSPATLTCPGDTLASAALSRPTTFGSLSGVIGAFALSSGLVSLVLGTLALVARRWVAGGQR